MSRTVAILSLLHEPANINSATRLFRGKPVLQWTLERVRQASAINEIVVLGWDDQSEGVGALDDSAFESIGARQVVPDIERVGAAQRWSAGWRGGLLDTCDIDAGYFGPVFARVCQQKTCDSVVVVSAASGLVDPQLLDRLIAHRDQKETDYCFSAAAPGLSGMVVTTSLLDRLAAAGMHPGKLLHYMPDQAMQDPITGDAACDAPLATMRTLDRFKLDSDRQITRLTSALESLNGSLIHSSAESIVHLASTMPTDRAFPRDVTLELNTMRLSKPIFSPVTSQSLARSPISLDWAEKLLSELAEVDDVRLTLGGVGDPLLHPQLVELIDGAHARGIGAIHVETDLIELTDAQADQLTSGKVDVITIDIPAMQPQTYTRVMGVDRMAQVLDNVRKLASLRAQKGRGVPLLVPRFMKCRENLDEMEAWYDAWLRALHCAVIAGPSDYCGQIADTACVDMAPPLRRACWRIQSRAMVLCDGTVVSCEQDFAGRSPMGKLQHESLQSIWINQFAGLRAAHAQGNYSLNVLCEKCREWHRP